MGEWTLLLSRWIDTATNPAPAIIRTTAAMPVGVLKKERLSVDPDGVVVAPPACAISARGVGLALATLAAAWAARLEGAAALAPRSAADASGPAQVSANKMARPVATGLNQGIETLTITSCATGGPGGAKTG